MNLTGMEIRWNLKKYRKRIFILFFVFASILCLCSCNKDKGESSFSIEFIDVGQGDSALIECDGHYMLIDGGDTSAGDKVYRTLEEKGVQRLDILAMSHLHADHIGGLEKALKYASKIDLTLSNSDYRENETFKKVKSQLDINRASITVPREGDKYSLGSSEVEVVDVLSQDENDSLVLLVKYGDTKFLFTGDIEEDQQTKISDKYQNSSDSSFDITLMKMPHHGSYTGTLYRFVRTFMPEYVVFSVGKNNIYGHPDRDVLDMLNSKTYKPKIYRTDYDGDIYVKSNGKSITIETEK